jgi:hypothetical protein
MSQSSQRQLQSKSMRTTYFFSSLNHRLVSVVVASNGDATPRGDRFGATILHANGRLPKAKKKSIHKKSTVSDIVIDVKR